MDGYCSWIKICFIQLNSNLISGAALSLGSIIGFFVGGWLAQYFGKRIMLVLCNACSCFMWIMLACNKVTVEFIIIERFSMGIFSATAGGCVGRIVCLWPIQVHPLNFLRFLHLGDLTNKSTQGAWHLPGIRVNARLLVGQHNGGTFCWLEEFSSCIGYDSSLWISYHVTFSWNTVLAGLCWQVTRFKVWQDNRNNP